MRDADLKRLAHLASPKQARLGLVLVFAAAICLGVGLTNFFLAAKYAAFANMSLWGAFTLTPKANVLYEGAVIRAVELATLGTYETLFGVIVLGWAVAIRRRSAFYARLHAELQDRGA